MSDVYELARRSRLRDGDVVDVSEISFSYARIQHAPTAQCTVSM